MHKNHEMVCAVRTERQTSNCDVKCRVTFILNPSFQCIRASSRLKNQYDVFVKVNQDGISCFHLFWSNILFMRQP